MNLAKYMISISGSILSDRSGDDALSLWQSVASSLGRSANVAGTTLDYDQNSGVALLSVTIFSVDPMGAVLVANRELRRAIHATGGRNLGFSCDDRQARWEYRLLEVHAFLIEATCDASATSSQIEAMARAVEPRI